MLDLARTVLSLSILIYASWSDYKTREVSNSVWTLYAPSAFTLTIIELLLYGDQSDTLLYGISFSLTTAFAIMLFYSGGFGGADAKALMCLALALPFHPNNLVQPLAGTVSPISQILFPIIVFSNSAIIAATTAIYILLRNILWHKKNNKKIFNKTYKNASIGRKILVLLTGYKVSINSLKQKWHVYPLEDIEDTNSEFKRKLLALPKDEGREAIVERINKAVENKTIEDMIWATPGLPMLIFITAGLVTALFLGDFSWIFIRTLLG